MRSLLALILAFFMSCAAAVAQVSQAIGINDYGPPEFGHGLTERLALEGWISLFDGKSTFGWVDAKVDKNSLVDGHTTSPFGACIIQGDVQRPGELVIGDVKVKLPLGSFQIRATPKRSAPVQLSGGAAVRTLTLLPDAMESLFNGKDLTGWKRIDRAKAPPKPPTWTVADGVLRTVGGPGALEFQGRRFGDLLLQVEARMNVRHGNGGLFFRAIPGDFMNGYEAQLYNRCHDGDVTKPWTWATGAIDDRQNARRLVSRDGAWMVQTVIAHGPHISTWVNGYQTVDWTDTRPHDVNPRKGLRLTPGVIQLQAHDPGTDLSFRRIAARTLE